MQQNGDVIERAELGAKTRAKLAEAAGAAYADGHAGLGGFIEDILLGRPAFIIEIIPGGRLRVSNVPPQVLFEVERSIK